MESINLAEAIAAKRQQDQAEAAQKDIAEKNFTIEQFSTIVHALGKATATLIQFLEQYEPKTEIKNFPKQIGTPDVKDVVKAVKGLEKTLKPQALDNSDVVKAIKSLNDTIAKLDQSEVKVSNLSDIGSQINSSLTKLQKSLDKVELSPKITVPKPQVTVQPTDVRSLVKVMKEVKQEVIDKPVPGTTVVQTDPLIRFTPVDMDDSSKVQYYSYIASKGDYYIRKVDKSGAYTTIRFYWGDGGPTAYNTDWANRASLTYKMWSE